MLNAVKLENKLYLLLYRKLYLRWHNKNVGLDWIWISPHYAYFPGMLCSFTFSWHLSLLPRSTERNQWQRKMEDGVDKKQINLFVDSTSTWNIYDFVLQIIRYAFLHKICARFMKWKMWFNKIDENGRKAVSVEFTIYSFSVRTTFLLRKWKCHNERE